MPGPVGQHGHDLTVSPDPGGPLGAQRPPAPKQARSNDLLSPWSHAPPSLGSTHKKAATKQAAKRRETSASPSPSRRRARSATTRKTTEPTHREQSKKNAKFRGVLSTLLSSERQSVEPGFQHLSDSGEYIQHYRAFHRRPASRGSDVDDDVSGDAEEEKVSPRRPHTSPVRTAAKSSARELAGSSTHECSKAQKGCPHYVPRVPCYKTDQSSASKPRSASGFRSITPMSVKGKQLDSGRNNFAGERGRRKFRFSKNHQTIIAETPKCKRIYLTWRQYLKYFSQSDSRRNSQDGDNAENDEEGGCTERPTTPRHPTIHRAATCVPVLDYDQSRVSSPVSPFRVDQSVWQKQIQSASSARDRKKDTDSSENQSCPKRPRTDTRRELHIAVDGFHTARARLSVCTVMDIQAAIESLTLSLERTKSMPENSSYCL